MVTAYQRGSVGQNRDTADLANQAAANALAGSPAPGHAIYFPLFDYLRIVLATAVAVAHSGLPVWSYLGPFSVQIFFALSGWLIGGILLHSTRADIPRFYFNRAARIWIPYVVAIGLLVVASLLKETPTAKWFEFVVYYVTFVYNFFGPPQLENYRSMMPLDGTGNHFWSICAEEQFYLVAPVLLTMLPRFIGRSVWTWLGIAVLVYFSPVAYNFGAITLGVLAAVTRERFGDWHLKPVATLGLIGLLLTSMSFLLGGHPATTVLAGFAAISTVLLLARRGTPTTIGTLLGGISYPLYLNHWIGAFVANALAKPIGLRDSVVPKIASIPVALAIATILYICIDQVIMKRRAAFFTKFRGKTVAATGYLLVIIGLIIGGVAAR